MTALSSYRRRGDSQTTQQAKETAMALSFINPFRPRKTTSIPEDSDSDLGGNGRVRAPRPRGGRRPERLGSPRRGRPATSRATASSSTRAPPAARPRSRRRRHDRRQGEARPAKPRIVPYIYVPRAVNRRAALRRSERAAPTAERIAPTSSSATSGARTATAFRRSPMPDPATTNATSTGTDPTAG